MQQYATTDGLAQPCQSQCPVFLIEERILVDSFPDQDTGDVVREATLDLMIQSF
jgi:hypothetical protein